MYIVFLFFSQFTNIQYTGSVYPAYAVLSAKIVRTARGSDLRDSYTYTSVSAWGEARGPCHPLLVVVVAVVVNLKNIENTYCTGP